MTDEQTVNSEDKTAGEGVTAQNTVASQSVNIEAPVEKNDPNADPNTPDSFGVSQAQYDKFYDAKSRSYNWEAHAKEITWQQSQKGTKGEPASQPTENQAKEAVDKAGLDVDALNAELRDDGKLSAESLAALKAVGIPEEVATGYAQYVVDTAEGFVKEVTAYLGGDDGIETLKTWALKNLSPSEIQTYEQKLSDPAEWKVWADSLIAKAGVKTGNPATLIAGNNAQGAAKDSAAPYQDMTELLKDQRNPKYRTDPQFRAQVMARARASTFPVSPRSHTVGL